MQGSIERNHLNNVIILGIPVRVIYGGSFFPSCGLHVLEHGRSFVLTGPCPQPRIETMALSYSLHGCIYGFEANLVGESATVTEQGRLRIGIPKRIARLERRKSYRVSCAGVAPVGVGVRWKDERIETRAVDISRHSIGLLLTERFPAFAVDSSIALAIRFPVLGDIFVTGTVRALRDSNGAQEMGVHFNAPSSPDQAILNQYIRLRERELGRAEYRSHGKPDGFMITKSFGGKPSVFWCPESLLESIKSSGGAFEMTPVDVIDLSEARDMEKNRYDFVRSSHDPATSLNWMNKN
jgi:hypothetical protein